MQRVKILSVENCKLWSWSLCILEIRKRLQYKYEIIRIVNCFRDGALYELMDYFDLILVQNIDSIQRIDKERRYKVVSRMGGTRTFELMKTPFDDEMKTVGAIIATNEKLFQLGKNNNDNTFLHPNGVDLKLFKPREQQCTPFDDNDGNWRPFIVGFAGNICGRMYAIYKGWKYISQATSRLYGYVQLKSTFYNLDQIPHNEMPEEFYHKIDCLILPSIDEGCSNVITEAMACGIPILCTKVGFHGERLENKVNCLFIKRDIQDIMDKIILLKNTPELRAKLAFESRLFAENNHDIDVIANEYDKIFQLVLKNNEGRKGAQ